MKRLTVIPAAGLATRMRPLSNSTSKTMLTVNGRPIISHIIDEVKQWSDKIVIVYGASDDIMEYCQMVYPDLDISFVRQLEPKGPLHAIYVGLHEASHTLKLSDYKLTVWLGDTIAKNYNPLLHNLSRSHVVCSPRDDYERWCLVDAKGKLHDKPSCDPKTTNALIGIYTFTNASFVVESIIRILDEEQYHAEYQISELLEKLDFDIILTRDWYDCGDLASLYDSRARLLSNLTVAENQISADSFTGTVEKTGPRCGKESLWYDSIPAAIKVFTPTIYSKNPRSYVMELCSGTSVQDIILYEDIKEHNLKYLIDRVLQTFDRSFCHQTPFGNTEISDSMYFSKFMDRIRKYDYEWMDNNDKAYAINHIKEMRDEMKFVFKDGFNLVKYMHGDFHFGNILFDFVSGKIKMIDPRGAWGALVCTHGNIEYDLIKMWQSVYAEYLWMCGGLPVNEDKKRIILEVLDNFCTRLGYNWNQIVAFKHMSVIFMAGCINFHDNNPTKQQRMWSFIVNEIKDN